MFHSPAPLLRPRLAVVGLALLAVTALPGCERLRQKFVPQTDFVEPVRPNDSCNSLPYRAYVGQSPDVLADLVFGGPVRWLHFGAPENDDYNPVRLNFDLDRDGSISRVWCG